MYSPIVQLDALPYHMEPLQLICQLSPVASHVTCAVTPDTFTVVPLTAFRVGQPNTGNTEENQN